MTQNDIAAPPALGEKLTIRDGHLVAAVDLVPGDLLFISRETPFTQNRANLVQKFIALPDSTRAAYHAHENEAENLESIKDAIGVDNGNFVWKPESNCDEIVEQDVGCIVNALDRLSIPVTNPIKGTLGHALFYPLLYLRKHSCLPSTAIVPAAMVRDPGACETMPVALVATLAVPAGTVLTHSRLPWHTQRNKRQKFVSTAYLTECDCPRCADDGNFRAADRLLLGTARGFSAENDPEDAAQVFKMREDYDTILRLMQDSNPQTDVRAVTDKVIEFLNEHTFLHIGHWRLWTLFNWAFILQVHLGQYVLAMNTVSAMMRSIEATAGDYPALEWASIAYKYKYVTYILKKSTQQAEKHLYDKNAKTTTPELYEKRIRAMYDQIDELFVQCKPAFVKTFRVFQMFSKAIDEETGSLVEVVEE